MTATCYFCGMEDLDYWDTYDTERPWLAEEEKHIQLLTRGRGLAHRDCVPSPSDISTTWARTPLDEECSQLLKRVENLFCGCLTGHPLALNTVSPVCGFCRKPVKRK